MKATILLILVIISLSCVDLHNFKFKEPQDDMKQFISDNEIEQFETNGISQEATIITKFLEELIEYQQIKMNCFECKLFFGTVQTFLQSNETDNILKEIAYKVCLKLNISEVTPLVCHGVIREFADEVIYVMTERFLDPTFICNELNLCNSSFSLSSSHPSSSSSFAYPSPSHSSIQKFKNINSKNHLNINNNNNNNNNNKETTSTSTGTFIHISDIHFDSRYKEGSNANCARPLCCREISDFPPEPSHAAGPWGDYNCDTPIPLLNNLLDTLNSLNPSPDFLIYTGDNSAHDIWAETQDMQLNRTRWLYDHIYETLNPNITFLPILGNHDSFPVDQFPNAPANSWLMNGVANVMEQWISNSSLSTFREGGYYTTLINSGFRFIGINTQYCDSNNFWLVLDWVDPMNQLDWLNSTLNTAKINNEKVLIAGHIPMPHTSCLVGYSTQYWKIIDEYNEIIIAQFFGHTHEDSFQIYMDYATNSVPISIAFISPSVTPYTEKNPSFRVYSYDKTSFEILDYDQFIVNLTEANTKNEVTWQLEYNAKSAYLLPTLNAESYYDLVMNSFPVNATMVDNYNIWFDASYDTTIYPCDADCVTDLQCSLTSSTGEVYFQCMGTQPSLVDWTTIMNIICP